MDTESKAQATPISFEGFIRLEAIIGNPKKGIPALLPVSKAAWYRGIAAGRYPSPVKLSERTSAWWGADIRRLLDSHRPDVKAA